MDYKQENMKHNLKVKCLKSYNGELTEGKIYNVIDISDNFYGLVNDEGETWVYYKGDFEEVKEIDIMSNNSTGLKELGVKRFITMLETDYKNGDITDDQYRYFQYELEIDNLDHKYGLYTAYLIMK